MKLTKALIILLFTTCLYSCHQPAKASDGSMAGTVNQQKEVISMLDSFNIAAANADYKTYFNFFTDYALFDGTDASERWDKKEFMVWAKPYFEKNIPGILQLSKGTFILTRQALMHGLMNY